MTLQEIQNKAQAIVQKWRDEDSAPYIEFVEELASMYIPELPEGVDEAADDYICDIRTAYYELEDGKKLFTEDDAAATFKAGAVWRDTQIKRLLEILLDNLEEAAEFFEKYFPKKRQEVK